MSEQVQEMNPFDIFNTKVEDMVSYEETERRDWSKTYLELDPKNGPVTVLVKLAMNIFNPKDPCPKRYTYKLPRHDNPSYTWNFVSPSTIGQKCPVMSLWFELNKAGKDGDAQAAAKAKQLSRKRYRCVTVQIINDLKNPENNGQFRLLRFPEGMELDNIIQSKTNPSEDEIKLGSEPENVYDPFFSSLLLLRCDKGDNGRDFSKSSWTKETKNHGHLVPAKYDEAGNILEYRTLGKADKDAADAIEHLKWLMKEMSREEISMKEQWMYKEPTEEILANVQKSIEMIKNGEYKEPEKQEGEAPAAEKMDEKVQTSTAAPTIEKTEPAPTPASESQSTGDEDYDKLMKELGV